MNNEIFSSMDVCAVSASFLLKENNQLRNCRKISLKTRDHKEMVQNKQQCLSVCLPRMMLGSVHYLYNVTVQKKRKNAFNLAQDLSEESRVSVTI